MSWLLREEFGLFLVSVAHSLIGRDAPDASVDAAKVIAGVPLIEVLNHLPRVLVAMDLDSVVLDEAVGALDQSVGFGRIGFSAAMLDVLLPAELLKRMNRGGFELCAPVVLETGQSELATFVREQLFNPERKELQTSP